MGGGGQAPLQRGDTGEATKPPWVRWAEKPIHEARGKQGGVNVKRLLKAGAAEEEVHERDRISTFARDEDRGRSEQRYRGYPSRSDGIGWVTKSHMAGDGPSDTSILEEQRDGRGGQGSWTTDWVAGAKSTP